MKKNILLKIWEFIKSLLILIGFCFLVIVLWAGLIVILIPFLFLVPILLVAFCLIIIIFYCVGFWLGDWEG